MKNCHTPWLILGVMGLAFVSLYGCMSSLELAGHSDYEAGKKAYQQGRDVEAERYYKSALDQAGGATFFLKRTLPVKASILNDLAILYRAQGKYGDADTMYRLAIFAAEEALGSDHPDVAILLDNLAWFLVQIQAKYTDAEFLYKRALLIREKALGPQHAKTAVILNALALLYSKQGKYVEAESLYQQSLKIWERTGPEDFAALGLYTMGAFYRDQGKYAEAEPLFQRALLIVEKMQGLEVFTASILSGFADLRRNQRKYAEAESLHQRALAIREKSLGPSVGEKMLGPKHLDMAESLYYLALLRSDQGKHAEAEVLYQRALAVREKVLGPDHPDVAMVLENMAELYKKIGKAEEAKRFGERVNRIRSRQR